MTINLCKFVSSFTFFLITNLAICVNCYAGGHTAEMLSIVNVLQKERFSPRFYVAAATDNMSLQKARVLEDSLEVYLLRIFPYFPSVLFVSLVYFIFMFG